MLGVEESDENPYTNLISADLDTLTDTFIAVHKREAYRLLISMKMHQGQMLVITPQGTFGKNLTSYFTKEGYDNEKFN